MKTYMKAGGRNRRILKTYLSRISENQQETLKYVANAYLDIVQCNVQIASLYLLKPNMKGH